MKRPGQILFACVLAVASILVMASAAVATPSKSGACTGCHTDDGQVVVSAVQTANNGTNASYSVSVSNPYGDGVSGWAAFDGGTKLASGYGSGSFSAAVGTTYVVYGVAGQGGTSADSIQVTPQKPATKLATVLSFSAPAVVSYSAKPTLSGKLAEKVSGKPLGGRNVIVEISKDGAAWTSLATVKTDSTGAYSAASPALSTARYFRARFGGSATHSAATSIVRKVLPKIYFATAPASSRYTHLLGTAYAVWGDFKPKHATGSTQIKLLAYRWERRTDGTLGYVLKRTITTTTTNPAGSAYSRYKVSLRLPYRGTWRVRAYHAADALNAATYSAYRSIAVK